MIRMSNTKSKLRQPLNLFIHLVVKIKNDDIFALASQLAYYLVLSFFPFIIFLITLVGFSSLSSAEVLEGLNAVLPSSIYDLTESIIREVFDKQYTGLLGVSIVLALWTASSGFRAVIKGVNKAYNLKETRSFFKRSLISMLSVLALAITLLLALGMLVFGRIIGEYLQNIVPFYKIIVILWNIFRYAFVFILMILIFAAIYRVAPSKRLKWREVIPGAIFSTIGWIGLSFVFSFYINNFRNYSRFYGSLGAVFILMTWLFLVSMIFIIGVEINCVITETRKRISRLD